MCFLLFSQIAIKYHLRWQDLLIQSKKSQENTLPSRELGGEWKSVFVLVKSVGCSEEIGGLSAQTWVEVIFCVVSGFWHFCVCLKVSKTGWPKWIKLRSLVLSSLSQLATTKGIGLLLLRGGLHLTPAEQQHTPGKENYTKSSWCCHLPKDVPWCSFCLKNR